MEKRTASPWKRVLAIAFLLAASGVNAFAKLDLTISLGKASPTGGPISYALQSDTLTLNTPKADSFTYLGLASSPIELLGAAGSGHRQVLAPGGLFDLVDLKDGSGTYLYTDLTFYHGHGALASGYYPGTDAYKTIRFAASASGTTTTLTMTETVSGVAKTTTYTHDTATGAWTLVTAEGHRKETQTVTTGSGTRTVTTEIRDASDTLVSRVADTYTTYAWGEELTQSVKDPTGLALTSTWTYEAAATATAGRLTQSQDENGHWEKYQYDTSDRPVKIVTQYLDAAPTATDAQSRVKTITYSGDNDQTEVTTLLGQEVARRYTTYTTTSGTQTQKVEDCTVPGAAAGASTNLVTTTVYLANGTRTTHPDGTLTITTSTTLTSGNLQTTTETGQASGTTVSAGKRLVVEQDPSGNIVQQTTTDISSSLVIAQAQAASTDAFGRPTAITYLNGTTESFTYGCCGLEQKTDATGLTTTYAYDPFGNVHLETRDGLSISTDYDPLGQLLRRYRIGSDSTSILIDGADYNLAGRQTATYSQLGTTTVSETNGSSGILTRTETLPGGATRIVEMYPDKLLKGIGGTSSFPQEFEYGVTSGDGPFIKTIKIGASGSTTEWSKTCLDLAGRAWKRVAANGAITTSYWNALGQLSRVVDADGVTSLFGYDALGERTDVAVDANVNNSINTSSDRVVRNETTFTTAHSQTVARSTTTEWNGGTAVPTAEIDASLTSLDLWTTSFGAEAHASSTLAGSGDYSQTVTSNTGRTITRSFTDGKLTSQTTTGSGSTTAGSQAFTYDAHHRVATAQADGLAATTFAYNTADEITSAIQAGVTTTYAYDTQGNPTSVSRGSAATTYTYFPNNLLHQVSGDLAYPASYTYDTQGRIKTLTTSGQAGSSVTTWSYDGQRGLLTSKRYADSKGPDYTYTDAGRLHTRTWARGTSSTYAYNALGDVTGIDYSDSTPDITLVYDQSGQLASTTQNSATFTYTHNSAGQLTDDAITGGALDGLSVTLSYDTYGRLSTVVPTANTSLTQTYTYDGASRLSGAGEGDFSATYTFAANSARITQTGFLNSGTQTAHTDKTYDTLGRLTSIATLKDSGGATLSSHSYTYNDLDQRILATLADGSNWNYAYDDLGQLTSGVEKTSSSVAIPGRNFGYTFDTIGNRTETSTNGRTATYTPNNLNQYTQREVPGAIDVSGKALASSTVTINNQPTQRQGDNFYAAVPVTNTTAPQYPEISVTAVQNNVGTGGEDLVSTKTGHSYLAKTPEAFTYDDDGNLLSDGRFSYTWDAENRLTKLESISTAPVDSKLKAEYTYDPASRRIQKKVWHWNTSTSSYDLTEDLRFLYQGWNIVAEVNTAGDILRSHLWGTDLSGSLQGAGGVGGLLATNIHGTGAKQMFPAYDGNGNVTAMASTTTGDVGVELEYDPFGRKLRASGADLANVSFGFSSKYEDRESTLKNFGLRFYSPDLGRWISSDSMGESGGLNLYSYLGDGPINDVDVLGNESLSLVFFAGAFYNWAHRLISSPADDRAAEFAARMGGPPPPPQAIRMAIAEMNYREYLENRGASTDCDDLKRAQELYRNQRNGAIAGFDEGLESNITMYETEAQVGLLLMDFPAGSILKSLRVEALAAETGMTNAELVQNVAMRADAWGTRQDLGIGPRAGTLKHSYADDLLTRYQRRFGERGLSTEVPYLNGQAGVGGTGSIRLDVVEGALDSPTAIFDYKFGGAVLTPERILQIRQVGQFGPNVPITGVHP